MPRAGTPRSRRTPGARCDEGARGGPRAGVIPAVIWGGLAIGAGFGIAGRLSGFCLLSGLRGAAYEGDGRMIRCFALALAVALVGTQALVAAGVIDVGRSVYARPVFSPLLIFAGGAIFGAGMALANGCGARALVLLGGGNLRSFVVILCLAVAGYATMSGVLVPLRMGVADVMVLDATPARTLPDLLAGAGLGRGAAVWLPVVAIAGLLGAFAFGHAPFRASPRHLFGGLAVGALVVGGWLVTGVLGADDFDPAPLASLSFIVPVGDAVLWLMLSTGKAIDFGAAVVFGVLAGSFAAALVTQEGELQGFASPGHMLRSMAGGTLMGIGGVLAIGCSIGQGLTGLSTLALTSLPAAAGIVAGALAVLGLLRAPAR